MNSQPDTNEPKTDRSICGFWRRIFALLIDTMILGIVGLILGTTGYDFFAQMGGYGRLVGFAIALTYFGFANSSIFGGQTFGKKLLKIQVVGSEGETISLPKSLLRYSVLGLPFFLNGAPVNPSLMENPIVIVLLGLIVFGMGGSIIYLYIFNRKTRQSLHDLVVGTYVVNNNQTLVTEPVWKGHFVTIGILFAAIVVGAGVFIPKIAKKQIFADLLTTQEQIQLSGIVHYSTVVTGTSWSYNSNSEEKTKHTYLAINASLKQRPTDFDTTIKEIAKIVFASYPTISEKDSLSINAIYGYDIGIARAWRNQNHHYSPEEWKRLLETGSLMK